MTTYRDHYDFHGISVTVVADHPGVLEGLRESLRHFPGRETDTPDMSFDFTTVPDLGSHVVAKPKGNARHLYYPIVGEALYVGRQIYVNYGDRGRVLCDPETGGARVSILKSEADDAWLVSHPMFVLPFLEILKRKGLYNLHAASLCHEGNGVLLPGGAGSGKSTLALGLVREGFDFLGDDMVFLNPGPEGLQMLAFPDVIDFTDETAAMFPELRDLPPRSQGSDRPKRQVRAEEVFPIGFTPTCTPRLLISPKVSTSGVSEIRRLAKDRALELLGPNVLLTEPDTSQRHLNVLAELVRSTGTHSLETGTDFGSVADQIRGLLS